MLLENNEKAPRTTAAKLNHDEAILARLGYKQEFRRVFTPIEVFGVGFSIIGLLPSMALRDLTVAFDAGYVRSSVLVYSIPNGGAAAMVWGWGLCAVFLVIIGLAMAELGSAAPTSGGLYYWTFMFSSPKWRCLLSWIVGYSNTVGNIASVASVDWGLAVQIMAAASIGSDMAFSATVGQTLLCLVIIIGVPAATPNEFRNSAAYAFGDFQNCAFDSTVHISEEATNADVAIPYAIILAASSSGILGWAINVALTFCMGKDLEGILGSPIGQPMATILFNSFGQRGTLAFWAWIIIVQWLYNVNSRTHAPVYCVWFAAGISLLLGLLAFAGANAIGAIFSLVVTGQYLAYSIPITARFVGKKEIKRGPFSLGRLSLPVAATAVTWMAFIIVVFLFPANPAPDSTNMNYTIVVLGHDFHFVSNNAGLTRSLGGTLCLAVVYYYFPVYGGVHWFKGPVQTIGDIDVASQDSGSEVKGESDSGHNVHEEKRSS
ncbi:hypothetical protein D9615_002624 [Tricholomella constricta]|uniref:Amino acid transporter n=1 Tax=Tricholomella constricta TaxID=117010 RepID=A0A8H5HM86_9AGAR|nr:hypothetical protein D9615_002624 [Tricholomella constricta]